MCLIDCLYDCFRSYRFTDPYEVGFRGQSLVFVFASCDQQEHGIDECVLEDRISKANDSVYPVVIVVFSPHTSVPTGLLLSQPTRFPVVSELAMRTPSMAAQLL